jgi:hypothetical protein
VVWIALGLSSTNSDGACRSQMEIVLRWAKRFCATNNNVTRLTSETTVMTGSR